MSVGNAKGWSNSLGKVIEGNCYVVINWAIKGWKERVEFVCSAIYAIFLATVCKKPRRAMIYYHSLKGEEIDSFEKQMAYLAKNCAVVKPSEIMTARTDSVNTIVGITFDDAFESVAKNAVPVLKRYGLPAAVFVPVGNLGRTPEWDTPQGCCDRDEVVMTKEQIVSLDQYGIEIFSHTISHFDLTQMEDDRMADEIVESKAALEEITGREIVAISYPYGAYDSKVINLAKRAGYKLGFTIEPSIVNGSTDNFQIGRFSVLPTDSLAVFKLKAGGAYQAVKYLRAMKRKMIGGSR